MLISLLVLLLFFQTADAQQQSKKYFMWFDATANYERFSYPDSIKFYLNKIKETGFTDAVIDIKPITGEVLYESRIAPQMSEWKDFKRDNFDYLRVFLEEGHRLGLRIHAAMNVFAGGHNFYDRGIVYGDKFSWQSVNYTDSGLVQITELKHKYSAMLNPASRQVQNYQISIIKEIVRTYPELDGIILDRVRYDGIESDFSRESEEMFSTYSGEEVYYPKDVYIWKNRIKGETPGYIKGRFFNKWLEWRVSVIYEFFSRVRTEVKRINPAIAFGDYAGAWYPLYYEVGVNWGSKKYDPSREFDWATSNYMNYGYAELLDFFLSGNYFFEVTKDELKSLKEKDLKQTEAGIKKSKEDWYSVEGSAEMVNRVTMGVVPVFAGLYVEQYENNSEQFGKAVKMCLDKSGGVMIFDIVHIINKDWWDVLRTSLQE
jgi:hypothetical protein